MKGPRHSVRVPALALSLAALLLLPGCLERKPIPSNPPAARPDRQAPAEQPVVPPGAAPAESPRDADEVVQPPLPEEPAAAAPKAVEAELPEDRPANTATAQPIADAAPENATPDAQKADAQKPDPPKTDAAQPEAAAPAQAVAEPAPKASAAPETTAAQPEAAANATPSLAKDAKTATQAVAAPRAAVVQVGAFGTEKNAEAAMARLREKGFSELRVLRLERDQGVLHRVQAGPFQDLATARKALEELRNDWPQAFIPAD